MCGWSLKVFMYHRALTFSYSFASFRLPVLCLWLCGIVLLCGANVPAQRAEPIITDDEVIEVETDLVRMDVLVTDAEGRPVTNLRAEDFKVYEDGAERPLAFFNIERRAGAGRPVAVVFALDVSGSMTAREIERLRSAVGGFARRLDKETSSFAVMSFGMRVRTLQNFTTDLGKLDRAFDRILRDESGLSTHAYDAVDDAVRLLARNAPRTRDRRAVKRVVLLITDGFPVGDNVAPAIVIERANKSDVSVFSVTLPSYGSLLAPRRGRAPLPTPLDVSGLVERTGGMNVYASDDNFDELFRRLAEDVQSAYVLSIYPPEEKRRDGRFHTLRVETTEPGFFIRQSRPGYTGKPASDMKRGKDR